MATTTDSDRAPEADSLPGGDAVSSSGSGAHIDRALLTLSGVVILGTVMAILDTTVVNVAINTLATSFHTTLPKIQWVATGYTLALATVIPLSGWVADRFGTKRIYITSITLFVIGSALSGIATSSTEIIVFRVLQGLGGGMIMPVGMTILTKAAGPQRIGRVMGIIGVPMLIGPILGPVLGGWLVTDVSWRWIFFINAPIGVVAVVAALRILPRDVARTEEKLDLVDLFLASPGLAILIYGIANSNPGGFGQAKVYIPLIVGVALLAAFVRHALGARFPLIDLRLFRNRVFSASSIALVLMSVSVFGSFLLLQLYLQEARGESALSSGLLMIPQGVGSMLMMPVCGALSDRTGSGRIAPVGLVLVGLSILYLTGVSAHTAYWKFEIDMFVNGLGLGITMMPIFTGAVQTLREAAVARASALLNIIQQGGASIGTSVLTVLLASEIAHHLGGHASTSSGTTVSAAQRAHAAAGIAAGFGDTFWWALALIAVALVASFWLPKEKPELADPAAAPMVL